MARRRTRFDVPLAPSQRARAVRNRIFRRTGRINSPVQPTRAGSARRKFRRLFTPRQQKAQGTIRRRNPSKGNLA